MSYNQLDGTVLNKPVGLIGKNVDLRSGMITPDGYRDYYTRNEALLQLTGISPAHTIEIRKGRFPVFVTPVGSTVTKEYWFVGGYGDINLVEKVGTPGSDGAPSTVPGPPGPPGASESVNIKTLGVYGNGLDETAAFAAAMSAAGNKTVLIENMTIKLRSIIVAGAPRFSVQGNGNSVIKMLPAATLYPNGTYYPDRFWYVGGVNGVRVSGIEFDMESAPGGPSSGTTLMYMENCQNVDIKHNYAHDNGHVGFQCVGCVGVNFWKNHVENTDSGIFVVGQSEDIKIVGNTVHGGTSEGVGIFNSANDTAAEKWVIQGNIIFNKGGYGINCNYVKHGNCSGNTVTNCLGGVMLFDAGSGQPAHRHSLYNLVANNTIKDCQYGVTNIGTGSHVTGNNFHNIDKFAIGTNNYVDYALVVDPTPTEEVLISDNHFYNCGVGGFEVIWLYNIKNSTFSNNHFYGGAASFQGLKLEKCENLTIRGNVAPGMNVTAYAGTDFTKKMTFIDNLFKDANITPADPLVGAWNWEFINTRFAIYEAAPTNSLFDATVVSGVLNCLNTGLIRDYYLVTDSVSITAINTSWRNRVVTLISKTSFTITSGATIVLATSPLVVSAGGSITLRQDPGGVKWRQQSVGA